MPPEGCNSVDVIGAEPLSAALNALVPRQATQ